MKKTALVIVAHPDDEVIGVGGTLLKLREEFNYDTKVAIITYAEHKTKWDCLKKSSEILKFDILEHKAKFKNTPNNLDCVPKNDLVNHIEEILHISKPDLVFTHHIGDLHQDHRALSEAVLIATRPYPKQVVRRLYTFETASTADWAFGQLPKFEPNIFIDIEKYRNTKTDALNIYTEEIRNLDNNHPRSLFGISSKELCDGLVVGLKKVESFKLIRSIDIL